MIFGVIFWRQEGEVKMKDKNKKGSDKKKGDEDKKAVSCKVSPKSRSMFGWLTDKKSNVSRRWHQRVQPFENERIGECMNEWLTVKMKMSKDNKLLNAMRWLTG